MFPTVLAVCTEAQFKSNLIKIKLKLQLIIMHFCCVLRRSFYILMITLIVLYR